MMKASDIDKVQWLLTQHSHFEAWVEAAKRVQVPGKGDELVIRCLAEEIVLKGSDGAGYEVLEISMRYAGDKIAAIEAELRALGVEP